MLFTHVPITVTIIVPIPVTIMRSHAGLTDEAPSSLAGLYCNTGDTEQPSRALL